MRHWASHSCLVLSSEASGDLGWEGEEQTFSKRRSLSLPHVLQKSNDSIKGAKMLSDDTWFTEPTWIDGVSAEVASHVKSPTSRPSGMLNNGAGEMAQWVTYMQYECEDLSQHPQIPSEVGWGTPLRSQSYCGDRGKMVTGESPEAHRLATLTCIVVGNRRSCLRQGRE